MLKHVAVAAVLVMALSACGDDSVPGPNTAEVPSWAKVARKQNAEGAVVGEWSEFVGGLRGRLVTSLGDRNQRPEFVSVYLELEPKPDSNGVIEMSAEREVRIELLDEEGNSAPRAACIYSGPVMDALPMMLTPSSRFREKVSADGCHIAGSDSVIICFTYACWSIKKNDGRTYSVQGTMTVDGDGGPGHLSHWKGTLILPPAVVDMDPR